MDIVEMIKSSTRVVVGTNEGDRDTEVLGEPLTRCIEFAAQENLAGYQEPKTFYVTSPPPITGIHSPALFVFKAPYLLFLHRTEASDSLAEQMKLSPNEVYALVDLNGSFLLRGKGLVELTNERLYQEIGVRPETIPAHFVATIQAVCEVLTGERRTRQALAQRLMAEEDLFSQWIGARLEIEDI